MSNSAILLTVFGGALLYSFLYPQPYLNQLPKKQQIALVDLDNTAYTRDLARKINSNPQIKITRKIYDKSTLNTLMQKREIFGYILIPKNFTKDMKLHKSPTISYGGNASFLLVYGSVAEGIFEFTNSLQKKPINLSSKAIFNPNIGYTNYIIPAIFILILHQIMAIGSSLQGATQYELKTGYWHKIPTFKLLMTRNLAYLILYLPICVYYLGFCFAYYDVPRHADFNLLLCFIILLIFTATNLGIALGEVLKRKEYATFVILVSSMPLVFSTGFIWPVELLPTWLRVLVNYYPTTPFILSFLSLNQMGAEFYDIFDKFIQILALATLYFSLSWYLIKRKTNANKPNTEY